VLEYWYLRLQVKQCANILEDNGEDKMYLVPEVCFYFFNSLLVGREPTPRSPL
jgi:hypothetical protein